VILYISCLLRYLRDDEIWADIFLANPVFPETSGSESARQLSQVNGGQRILVWFYGKQAGIQLPYPDT
jgi:hypothetical protein